MDERLRKHLADRADAAFMSCLTGGSTCSSATTAPAGEPLTLDKLQRLIASMPKPDVWLSTRLFPADNAITVEGGSERFTVAGPGFWTRVRDHLRTSDAVKTVSGPPPMWGMNLDPIEIDPWPEDSPETALWRAGYWDKLREAMNVAMVPLPEWLRAPPKFGKHG